ncbi:MAG: ATP-binding protein [Mogibacterium sp.]|nr:ATP-binding protein [Mogibacterium sp.]
MIQKQMFRLLPVQILMMAVGAVNGIVSSYFATNYVGLNAMTAVGLYNPVNLLFIAMSVALIGGSAVLSGKYMGRNEQDKLQNIFSEKRAYLAGLALEEMAGNVIEHGFSKDSKNHTVDVRVVHKDDDVILRIKDDCIAFDPGTMNRIAQDDDRFSNIGIRMVFGMAQEVKYQNILGMNALTIRI